MKIFRYFALGALAVLTICFAGCASIVSRSGRDDPKYLGLYSGVRWESYYIAHPQEADPPASIWLAYVDFPFTFVTDTVLLPFDGIYLGCRASSKDKSETP